MGIISRLRYAMSFVGSRMVSLPDRPMGEKNDKAAIIRFLGHFVVSAPNILSGLNFGFLTPNGQSGKAKYTKPP